MDNPLPVILKLKFQTVNLNKKKKNCYLFDFLEPPINTVERPLVRDVVHEEYPLRPPRVRAYYCTEPPLARRVPQLKFHSLAV